MSSTWTAGRLPLATGGATVGAVTSSQGNATDPRGVTAPRGDGAADAPPTADYGRVGEWDVGCRFDFENPDYRLVVTGR